MDISLFKKSLASKQKLLAESADSVAAAATAVPLIKKALDKVESSHGSAGAAFEAALDLLKKVDSLVKNTDAYTRIILNIKGISGGLSSGITLKGRLESAIEFAGYDRRAGEAAADKTEFVYELTDIYLHLKHIADGWFKA
jgi:hypothetical protein